MASKIHATQQAAYSLLSLLVNCRMKLKQNKAIKYGTNELATLYVLAQVIQALLLCSTKGTV